MGHGLEVVTVALEGDTAAVRGDEGWSVRERAGASEAASPEDARSRDGQPVLHEDSGVIDVGPTVDGSSERSTRQA